MDDNFATIDGGAIWATDSAVTVSDSRITNNEAVDRGAAIFISTTSSLHVDTVTFQHNLSGVWTGGDATATNGGAILVWDTDVTIANATFLQNSSRGFGGALHLAPGAGWASQPVISDTRFAHNTADWWGGGAINIAPDATAYVSSSEFTRNGAFTGRTGRCSATMHARAALS